MSVLPNEGNQEGTGEASAKSSSSAPSGQPLEADFSATIAALTKKIDAQQGEINALKSGKDKAVDRVIKSQEETLARLAQYLNVPEAQVREAQRQSVLDDLVAERLGGRQQETPAGGTVGVSSIAAELQSVDELLDLPANDSRVIDLKLQYGNDLATYKTQAKALRSVLLSSNNQPSPAEMPLPPGQSPPRKSDKTPEQLQADMNKELAHAAATLRGDQRLRVIADIKAKYRGEGLQVL